MGCADPVAASDELYALLSILGGEGVGSSRLLSAKVRTETRRFDHSNVDSGILNVFPKAWRGRC